MNTNTAATANPRQCAGDYRATSLVLGCSRLGSVLTPLDRRQSIDFLHLAFDLGVRDFDTANIYGQGDSERYLGEAFRSRRSEVRLASKAGQRLSLKHRAMSVLKGPARLLARTQGNARAVVASQRTHAMRFDFAADAISRSLEHSLRRLKTEHLDIFYLHSPPVEVLQDEALARRLEQCRVAGKFRWLGVSCDDAGLAQAALHWRPADVVQFDVADAPADFIAAPPVGMGERKTVLLRGMVRHGRPGTGSESQLGRLLARDGIGGLVIGTTTPDHLRHNIALVARLRSLGHVSEAQA